MKIRAASLLVSLVTVVLSACGSGGDSGSTSAATNGGNAGGGGSTVGGGTNAGGSAAAPLTSSGSISAFGSVYINGNHFNITGAQITIDDDPATEQDLQVGHTAMVTGTAPAGAGLAMATLVAVRSQVVGPVTSVSTATSSFVVLGQTVKVGSETSFDSVISPADITGIQAGDLVAVHGPIASDGSITARRLGRATAAMGLRVSGTVSSVNTTARTFKINALTVNYAAANPTGFASGAPANGDSVRVAGTAFTPGTTTLAATTLVRVAPPTVSTAAHIIEVEGLVTRFASLTDFDIAGQKVTTSSSTVYVNGTSADIALNADVEAHGTMSSSGVLTATSIDTHNNGLYTLNAPVTALSATAGTVTVLGVTATVNSLTRLEDRSSLRVRNFAFTDLRIGDNLAVVGYQKPAGSGQLVATLLTRLPASTVVTVAGPFTATTAPQFRILGVTVNAASASFSADRVSALNSTQFFAQAVGRQVAVVGTGSGPVVASKVTLLPVDFN